MDTRSQFIQVCVLVTVASEVRRFERAFNTTWPAIVQAHDWVSQDTLGDLAFLRYQAGLLPLNPAFECPKGRQNSQMLAG
jgi:hypothetical protein